MKILMTMLVAIGACLASQADAQTYDKYSYFISTSHSNSHQASKAEAEEAFWNTMNYKRGLAIDVEEDNWTKYSGDPVKRYFYHSNSIWLGDTDANGNPQVTASFIPGLGWHVPSETYLSEITYLVSYAAPNKMNGFTHLDGVAAPGVFVESL